MALFSATDGSGSGVAHTEYSTDGGSTWTPGIGVLFTLDGDHDVLYRSIDLAGNLEESNELHVLIDTTAPVTTDDAAAQPWTNQTETIHLAPTDSLSGMNGGPARTEYSSNGGATWSNGSPIDVHPDPVGHTTDGLTVLYRSTDAAGNVEATRSCVAHIDTRGPTTSGRALAVKRGKKAIFRVTVADPRPCSASGAKVTIKIRTAKGNLVKALPAFAGVATNATVSLVWARCTLAVGTYSYTVTATDAAGNAQVKAGGSKLTVK